jgi:erythromycin esterase-like protein
MGQRGELNVGQLARDQYGAGAVLVGFTTYTGTVTAAAEWDGPAHRKQVRPALAGSYERLFHDAQIPRFLLSLRTDSRSWRRRSRRLGWSERLACCTCRKPSAPATISTHGWPISSISSCTSTRHARSNRWKRDALLGSG